MRLTPTEDLFMELLAARHRLGEQVWTFDSRLKPQALRLERLGLIGWKRGAVERTLLVWLTGLGRTEYLDPLYVPPILAKGQN